MSGSRLALAIASALLYAAAFPPLGWWPLMWLALAPFFAGLVGARPREALLLGAAWSLVHGLALAFWLPEMFTSFFGVRPVVAWAGWLAVAIGLSGIYYTGFAVWVSWLAGRGRAHPLALALGWCACEFARATLIVGNPWALSGYSQLPFAPFVQAADLAGVFGLGFLIAAANAMLAALIAPGPRTARPRLAAAAVAILLVATLAYGRARLTQRFDAGDPIEVALVQGALDPARRGVPAYRDANLAHHLALSEAVGRADLVFWPELALDFYLRDDTPQRARLVDFSRELPGDLLVGGPDYRFGVGRVHRFNSMFLLRGGAFRDRYDKVRLMPFSETNPLRAIAPIGRDRYTPGPAARPVQTRAGGVGVILCSEARDARHVRGLVAAGAEILANPSNDYWFHNAGAARHQLDAVALRAIENRRYVVRPTASGFTAVIDPHGRVTAAASLADPEVLHADVHASHAVTPYQRSGDTMPRTAAALAGFWSFLPTAGRRRARRRDAARTTPSTRR